MKLAQLRKILSRLADTELDPNAEVEFGYVEYDDDGETIGITYMDIEYVGVGREDTVLISNSDEEAIAEIRDPDIEVDEVEEEDEESENVGDIIDLDKDSDDEKSE